MKKYTENGYVYIADADELVLYCKKSEMPPFQTYRFDTMEDLEEMMVNFAPLEEWEEFEGEFE